MTVNAPIDIINIALIRQGIRPGTSPSENSKSMQFMSAQYQRVRDLILNLGDWNCATKRVTLSRLSTTPAWGFDNEYQLPADFIRFHRMWNLGIPFQREGRKFLCDHSDVDILYIYRLEHVAEMDETFKTVVAGRLAYETVLANKSDLQQVGVLKQMYDADIVDAFLIDALQSPVETMRGSTWLRSHYAWPHSGYRPIENTSTPYA